MSRRLTALERFELHRHISALKPTVDAVLAAADRHVENARLVGEYRELASAAEREIAQAVRQRAAMDALAAERAALRLATKQAHEQLERHRQLALSDEAAATNDLRLAGLYRQGNAA
jgi:hypothetical protein